MFKGILQEVLVDEYFPIQKLTSGERLLGCYPCRGKNEIYTMILEKCWAKLWGSYEKIDGKSLLIQVAYPTKPSTHSPGL
jgi:hypothetical protein